VAEIRYDHREGNGKGREMPVAADQYISRRGGKFVFVNTAGHLALCATQTGGYETLTATTSIYGWANTPKDAAGYNAWKSSSTAGADKMFVVYELDGVFEMPYVTTASVTASMVGKGARIGRTGTTYTTIQYAEYQFTPASTCLTIVDFDAPNGTVWVKVQPQVKQAGM